eukprot:57619-Lingulodinium_polyedra.AAC.1
MLPDLVQAPVLPRRSFPVAVSEVPLRAPWSSWGSQDSMQQTFGAAAALLGLHSRHHADRWALHDRTSC